MAFVIACNSLIQHLASWNGSCELSMGFVEYMVRKVEALNSGLTRRETMLQLAFILTRFVSVLARRDALFFMRRL